MTEDEIKSELKRIFGDGWVKYYPSFNNPSCETCRFYAVEMRMISSIPITMFHQELTKSIPTGQGDCRRNPPSLGQTRWPTVKDKHWCGEWKETK